MKGSCTWRRFDGLCQHHGCDHWMRACRGYACAWYELDVGDDENELFRTFDVSFKTREGFKHAMRLMSFEESPKPIGVGYADMRMAFETLTKRYEFAKALKVLNIDFEVEP
jgi:hypothetical protein